MAFWQVCEAGFLNLDDAGYVTANSDVQHGLTRDGVIRAFTSAHSPYWHPVTWLSHMLDVQMYGMNPAGHHLTNLVLHLANTLLLFWVLLLLTGGLWRSALVAALFGLHPLHVESVAWIAERKDVLSTFFWMLTMLAYARYAKSPRLSRYIGVPLLFAVGLMSKPMLVTLPFALLLLDYWPLRRFGYKTGREEGRSRSWLPVYEKIPLFLLSATSSVVTYLVQQRIGAMATTEWLPFGMRAANALVAYVAYIAKMLWPKDLAIFYPYPGSLPAWKVAGAALVLLLLTAMAIRTARSRPYLAVGWFWYLGTLVPAIGFVQVGMQAMADRFTYVPLIGLFIMIAWGIPERPRWIAAAAGIAVAVLMVRTSVETGYWRDNVTIFSRALACTEDNYIAHNNLGIALVGQGKLGEAMEHYRAALAIAERLAQAQPDRADYQSDLSDSYVRVGDLYSTLGQGEQAREYFGKALAIRERLAQAEPDRADSQRDLSVSYERAGDLYLALGQGEQAREYFRKALAIAERLAQAEPDRADYQRDLSVSYNKAGDLYLALGQGEQAREYFRKALAIRERLAQAEPDRPDSQRDLSVSYNQVGDLCLALGQGEQAREYFMKALAITERLAQAAPDRADYQRDLSVSYNKAGDLYRALGQEEQARECFMKALAIRERLAQAAPDRPDYQRDLAVSLVKVGTSDEPPRGPHLQRALSILESLKASGQLAPADEPMVKGLRQLMRGPKRTGE